jgi:hypothetical protein
MSMRPVGCPLRRSGGLALARRHALDRVHPPVRGAPTIAKTLDAWQL